MIRLNMQQVLLLHEELIQETGGIHGLRDENLLESVLAAPFQTFNDQPLYPSTALLWPCDESSFPRW